MKTEKNRSLMAYAQGSPEAISAGQKANFSFAGNRDVTTLVKYFQRGAKQQRIKHIFGVSLFQIQTG